MNITDASIKKVYFVGIKGVAMAALAVYVKESGVDVAGSDVAEVFPSDEVLASALITPHIGFSSDHIDTYKPDAVVYTGAHLGKANVEVARAIEVGIPVYPHGKALGEYMNGKKQISVAGSHGKTTTSSMIATILAHAGLDPSYAIGCGVINGLGLPGHAGRGQYFVAEADEYVTDPTHDQTPRFLWQKPNILVVTNIDFDHPDVYASVNDVRGAFQSLADTVENVTILNADDPQSLLLSLKGDVLKISSREGADYWYEHVIFAPEVTTFDFCSTDGIRHEFALYVPGVHNVSNATLAVVACLEAGLTIEQIHEGLASFRGAKRRFEFVGQWKEASVYDDYAHHPREIDATIRAAKRWFPRHTIIVVFQPHTYSRTMSLLPQFAQAFTQADVVLIADIYSSAREIKHETFTSATVVDGIKKNNATVFYTPNFEAVKQKLEAYTTKESLIIFMGAGDIYQWSARLVEGKQE